MIIRIVIACSLLTVLAGAQGGVCTGAEEPCDPNKPWMRGMIEKSCALPQHVERLKQERPGAIVLACHCQHQCKPDDEHAEETDGRSWDAACQARCNPANCACVHPCL